MRYEKPKPASRGGIECEDVVPSFAIPGAKRATHCVTCKTEDMVAVKNRMCSDLQVAQ